MYRWLIVLLFSVNVYASPLNQLQKVGAGEMNYLFWTLYRAELFASDIPFDVTEMKPKALRIEYYKEIDKQALIDVTGEQWLQLGYDAAEIELWLTPLAKIWPDVAPGDVLTLLVTQDSVSHFYFDDELIGVIDDPRFGNAFLSIWLSENTSEPRLRKQLLGLTQ